jgi:AcrR family transcriptional regulator
MAETGMARPSFYAYFRDRHHLVLRLAEQIGVELFSAANRWFECEEDQRENLRFALAGVVDVFVVHGAALAAMADASAEDAEVERVYRGLVESLIDATTRTVKREIRAGRIAKANATETARALVWMTERYLSETLGRAEAPVRPKTAQTVLADAWTATLYGTRATAPAHC